jgi:hypothetical protein
VREAQGVVIGLLIAGAFACSRPAGEEPRALYDPRTGRLRQLAFDMNKNGTNDSVSYMDGTRMLRVELDLDENGQVERWDFYGEDRTLERVGLSQRNDGVMDAQAFYTEAGELHRIEISTKRDGRFDRTEFYEANVLVRSEEDTNGDGRPNEWETYRPVPDAGPNEPAYGITSTAFDDSGSGRPERRFVYGRDGSIDRVELDPDGDGIFTTPQHRTP